MRHFIFVLPMLVLSFAAQGAVNVVTTTQDLAALVTAVGGDQVTVFSIGKGTQDAHRIEAKPSFMVKMRNADLVVSQGLELETAWLEPLLQGGRNPKVMAGTTGFLELGPSLDPIEIPKGAVSRAEGDVHPGGNPHFQLDPVRLGKAAELIALRLGELDAAHKELYLKNAKDFRQKMDQKTTEWKTRLAKTGVNKVITYHKGFSYFLDRFGIETTAQLEPKPGIPPTVSHLIEVIGRIKKNKVKLVLIENYNDAAVGEKLKREVPGLTVKVVPVSVGGDKGVETNEQLLETLVKTFEAVPR